MTIKSPKEILAEDNKEIEVVTRNEEGKRGKEATGNVEEIEEVEDDDEDDDDDDDCGEDDDGCGIYWLPFDIDRYSFYCGSPPQVLKEKGLSDGEWTVWMKKLTEAHRTRCSKDCEQLWCALVGVTYLLVFPIIIWCNRKGRMIKRWNKALLDWQKRYNDECLSQYGIYCKTQSVARRVSCVEISYDRFISFAYTPAGIELLKQQPHILGEPTNNCSCCWHNPEKDLCMHPEYEMEW